MLFKNSAFLLTFLFTRSLSLDVDEAFVETVDNEYDSENLEDIVNSDAFDSKDGGRRGRSPQSYGQNPLIDIVIKSSNYRPNNAGDFFHFLRDSYPLPGGLTSPLPEYDFIIVGASPAGCALASRLTENRNTTVLLLEAGKPEMILTDIPALAPYFQNTDYTWKYYTEPQPGVCKGMLNGRCVWPRGKAVGGGSVVNYMIYTRGRPQDWDRIAAAGNYGWSFNDVLYYFMKSEKASLKGYEKSPYRSRDGVLPIEFPPIETKLVKAFLKAGQLLGHPTVDYNAPDGFGFGKVQVTVSGGHRQSAAKAYLHNHKKRKNLHVMPETTATKILIGLLTKTAYGVEYVHKKRKYTAQARKEVVLSAGTIASPQLLMLSGIGPQEHLNSIEIPVIQDLPVGQNLYDHIGYPGLIFTMNVSGVSFLENRDVSFSAYSDWVQGGDSTFSTPGAVESLGFFKTHVSDDPELVPDIEIMSFGGSFTSDGGPGGSKAVRKGMRINETVFDEAFGEIGIQDNWSAFPMLLHPKSVGYLELRDKNPFRHPRIFNNYLTDPRDVATLVASIRHVQALAATEPFQKYGLRVHRARFPTCPDLVFDSDEYWECALRTLTTTIYHQMGTCRMGPAGDPLAVVDPELRVHGIQRLRVVDASILPRTLSGHTNGPAIMIGEKAADMIKYSWGLK